MDVELQILKHLARDPHPTVTIIDSYCAEYKDLFKEVRNKEVLQIFTLGDNINDKKKIVTRDSEGSEYKFGTVITPFFSFFRLVSK